jgi:hypothetical protein
MAVSGGLAQQHSGANWGVTTRLRPANVLALHGPVKKTGAHGRARAAQVQREEHQSIKGNKTDH